MKAELHLAWMWDCDECGAENFERSFIPEMTEEHFEILMEDDEEEEIGLSRLQSFPSEVFCRGCGLRFETQIY